MNKPDWYWSPGLHDAKITSATVKTSWDPQNTCLVLTLDKEWALFQIDIEEIRFYNFKILTPDIDIESLVGGFWLSDTLVQQGDRWILDLKFDTAKCKTKRLEMKFQRAQVIRRSTP